MFSQRQGEKHPADGFVGYLHARVALLNGTGEDAATSPLLFEFLNLNVEAFSIDSFGVLSVCDSHLHAAQNFAPYLKSNGCEAISSAALAERVVLISRNILLLAHRFHVPMSVIGIHFKRYEPLCVSEQKTIKVWHSTQAV
jgi:hypothetical protein